MSHCYGAFSFLSKQTEVVVLNNENLIPFDKRTKSEQREIASKGGKASGEARKKKRTLKDGMRMLMDLEVADRRSWNKCSRLGIDIGEIDNEMLMLVALMKKAQSGDVSAFDRIKDLLDDESDNNNGQLSELIEGLKDE